MFEDKIFSSKKYQNKYTELIELEEKLEIDKSRISIQTIINIQGIEIYFPYKPYEIQINYMNKIIESLNNNKSIAALESPRGTGKTLCLLCACLAWIKFMREVKNIKFKIYYSSRTHSQISNVIQELKKTIYLPITCILSSRNESCLNISYKNFAKSNNSLNTICKRNKKKCIYYNNTNKIPILSLNNIDLEELCEIGLSQNFCPFHFEGDKNNKSDITFLPFNYIIDKEIKDSLNISLENTILIIDEAHNIENVLENSFSIELITYYFDSMINELKDIINVKKSEEGKSIKNKKFEYFPVKNLLDEINILNHIKDNIENINHVLIGDNYPRKGKILENKEFFSLFMDLNDNFKNDNIITIDEMFGKGINTFSNNEFLTPENLNRHYNFLYFLKEEYLEIYNEESLLTPYIRALELIKHLYFNLEDLKSFIFYVYDGEIELPNNYKVKTRFLKLLCFDSGFGFNKILKELPYNIILTSDTLCPFESLEYSLKTLIPIKLENEHIIDKSHLKFHIIKSENLNNKRVEFKFDNANRTNLTMIKSLGKIIYNYVKSLEKGGILIFFPTFNFLNKCYSIWFSEGLISKISYYKKVYLDNKINKNIILDFMSNNNKNSIILSVIRSNILEGLDFKNDYVRIVICIGIPYANYFEDRIQLKMKFLNNLFKENLTIKHISGDTWYTINAIQAVNQSLGRILSNKFDFGMMICIDCSFDYNNIKCFFSRWMKNICDVVNIDNLNYFNDVKKFFNQFEIENSKTEINKNEKEKEKKFLELFNMGNNKKNNNINDEVLFNNNYSLTNKKKNNYKNIINNNNGFINYKELKLQKNEKRKAPYIYNEKSIFENLKKKKGIQEIMISNENILDIQELIQNKHLNTDSTKFSEAKKLQNKNNYESEYIYFNNNELELNNKLNDNLKKKRESSSKELKNKELNIENQFKKENIIIQNNENNTINNEINKENDKINEIVNKLNNNLFSIEKKGNFYCPICFKEGNENFSISKCNHILCNECWAQWIFEKMECPLCKKKVRFQTLFKLKN